jgi:hypothetical protein
MKNSPITKALLGLVATSAVVSLIFCFLYIKAARELRTLQGKEIALNNNRALISMLLNDAIEYSKKNPAINPILQAAGVNTSAITPGTAPKPASAK